MPWNWQLPEWPHFTYNFKCIAKREREFLLNIGSASAFLNREDYRAFQGSRIGELLNDVYETFDAPLTHEMLWSWHSKLSKSQKSMEGWGKYRTGDSPKEIIAQRHGFPRLLFEAPPSSRIPDEMDRFLEWFNSPKVDEAILGRAAIVFAYFESIHPFHDGNGRIGRILIEKALSQGIGKPTGIALASVLEVQSPESLSILETCNRSLQIQEWVEFFADLIVREVLKIKNKSIDLLHSISKNE